MKSQNATKRARATTPAIIARQRLFISHSVKDAQLVAELSRLLQTGLMLTADNIFVSSIPGQGLLPGEPIVAGLWERVSSSALILFVVSNSFLQSAYSMCELGAVWGAKKKYIPLLVPPLTYSDLPGVLSNVQSFSFTKDRDLDGVRDYIVDAFPYLRRKGGFASWANAKDHFSREIVRLISQYSPERLNGQDSVAVLSEKLQVIMSHIRRAQGATPSDESFFVLIFDIDRITQINDQFGYMVGNHILTEMGNFLKKSGAFIETNRCGDDTFFGILWASENHAIDLARHICADAGRILLASAKAAFNYDVKSISVSCGVADLEKCSRQGNVNRWFYCAFYACNQAKLSPHQGVLVSNGELYCEWS
jgi:diguanylate cyclase (GGDEF)-like protein